MDASKDDENAWRAMANDGEEEEDIDFDAVMKRVRDSESSEVVSMISKAVALADRMRTDTMRRELEERKMVNCNHMVTLHIIYEGAEGGIQHFRLNIMASAQLSKVEEAMIQRMGKRWPRGAKPHLSWLRSDGAFLKLTQTTWREYVFSMWCTQPWTVHLHDASRVHGIGEAASVELQLDHTAKILFERYVSPDSAPHSALDRQQMT